jgi:hypothetical protein
LVERHRHIGPVIIDIDLRQRVPDRQYTSADIERLVTCLMLQLRRLVTIDDPAALTCYVLEKPKPRPDKKPNLWKDGIHLHFPGIVTRPQLQLALRTAVLPAVDFIFLGPTHHPLANDAPMFLKADEHPAEKIYDEAVIEKNGWFMYGSKKPDELAPWRLTRILRPSGADGVEDDGEALMRLGRAAGPTAEAGLAWRLSIRNCGGR